MARTHRKWFRDRGLLLPADLAQEDWRATGAELARRDDSLQWYWGDWVCYWHGRWGETYDEAMEISGLDYHALRSYRWVASEYEFATRVANVCWSHYREAASVDDIDTRLELLHRAEKEGWTVVRLRKDERRAKYSDEPEEVTSPMVNYAVYHPRQTAAEAAPRVSIVASDAQQQRPFRLQPLSGAALLDLEEKHNLAEAIELFSGLDALAAKVDVESLASRLHEENPTLLQAVINLMLRIKVILDRQRPGSGPGLRPVT